MNKIDTIAAKLRLLGDDIIVTAEDAIIDIPQSRNYTICYNVASGKILSKKYDEIVTPDKSNSIYYIGVDNTNSHILDKHLVILAKYYNEKVKAILLNQFVIVFRPISNSYRLSTISGAELSDGILSAIHVWGLDSKNIIARLSLANGTDCIIRVNNARVVSKFNIEGIEKVFVGVDIIAVQTEDNKVTLYDTSNSVKLIVKKGKVLHKVWFTDRTNIGPGVYVVTDPYGNEITNFESLVKLY